MLVINNSNTETSDRPSRTYGTFSQNSPPVIAINTHGKAIRLVLTKSGFYILSQLITPLEHLFVSYQFARLGSDGEAAYALILTSRGVLNTLIATVSAKLSSEISKSKGKADKGEESYSIIGEKFRVGIALSLLESLISASLFCFAADPLYSLLGQSPKAINIAVPYLQRYALATIAKGIANPHNAVANGLLNPKLSWFIRTLCVVAPNATAYFYYRPDQGNTEVFAYAAIAKSILNTLIMTGIMKIRSGYRPYKLFTLSNPSRATIKKFLKELKHLFKASSLYALQTMCELSVLFAQAVYVKSRESEEALAFYGAGSQIIMFLIAGAMGFHFTAMNHSGVRLAHSQSESWLIAKAGLLLGAIPPLIATSLLLSIPQEISKVFIPPASYNSTSLNPELFGTLGPLLTGSTFFDTLRLGAGILLINYNEHFKPAVTGVINLWGAFSLAIILHITLGIEPLMAFAIANYSLSLGAMTLSGVLYRRATKQPQVLGDNIDQQSVTADYTDVIEECIEQPPRRRCLSEPNLIQDRQVLEVRPDNEGVSRSLSTNNLTFFQTFNEKHNSFIQNNINSSGFTHPSTSPV